MNNTNHLPLPDDTMPPLPQAGERGLKVCATVQLYLAVLDDLPPEQVQTLLKHVRTCAHCSEEQRLMRITTRLLATHEMSTPSIHVDRAVMAAIATRGAHGKQNQGDRKGRPYNIAQGVLYKAKVRKRGRSIVGATLAVALASVVLAAVLLLAPGTISHFLMRMPTPAQAFVLPTNLTWSGYVVFHSETKMNAKGERYRVDSYHDLGTGRIHVETVSDGSVDVVMVGDKHTMLGLDMMHHVAQWGADKWSTDESPFDLAELRSDLAAKRAFALDKDTFQGQEVYRIRCRNGVVLLLDTHYRPVNVLRGGQGSGSSVPMYDKLELKSVAQVPGSMWNMNVPAGFHMGTLPPHP